MDRLLAEARPALDQRSSTVQGRLVVSCADASGLIAEVTRFLQANGAVVTHLDHDFADLAREHLVLRVLFDVETQGPRLRTLGALFQREIADRYRMMFRIRDVADLTRVAIFVSREDHCMTEILLRWWRRELPVEIVQVVSNHVALKPVVSAFKIPYAHIPVTAETRLVSEREQLALLSGRVDLIVLARYMQVLSKSFLTQVNVPVINIHHSILPSFAGARPYERARERGVKVIGATAHYATEILDEGPIIEQDVARTSHRLSVAEMKQRGAEIERAVLARAVLAHCEDRVFCYGNHTIVF